jgi:hypothetical protein
VTVVVPPPPPPELSDGLRDVMNVFTGGGVGIGIPYSYLMTGINTLRLCDAEVNKALKLYLTEVVLKDTQLNVTSVRYSHNEHITEVTLEGTETVKP